MAYLYSANQGNRVLSGSSVSLSNGVDNTPCSLRFLEDENNGTHYVGFMAADSISSNVIWTLPSADGSNGQVLSTNGATPPVLSWAASSGSPAADDIGAGDDDIDLTNTSGLIRIDSDASTIAIGGDSVAQKITVGGDVATRTEVELNAILLDFNAGASGVTIDTAAGGGISLDAAGAASNFTLTSDGAGEDLTIALAGATDSSLILSSTGTGVDALQVSTSAGGMDITVAGAGAGEDLDIACNQEIRVTSTSNAAEAIYLHANGGTGETVKIHSDLGTGEGNGSASIELLSDVGGICLTATGLTGVMTDTNSDAAVQLYAAAGGVGIRSAANLAGSIQIEADGGTSETIIIKADQSTVDGAAAAGAIQLLSDAGGIGLSWADGKDLWAEGGRAIITANEDAASCIKLHADAGTSQTIHILNDAGTSATEGAAAIQLLASAGGINLKSNLNNSAAILLTADGGTSAEIKVHNDQGTADDSIYLVSDAGGVKVEAGGNDGITMAGAVTFQQGFTIGSEYYVTGATGTGWDDKGKGYLTASYIITDNDNVRFFPVSASTDGASSMTITLPTAAANAGRVLTIKDVAGNCDDNVITIGGENSELVDGKTSIKLDSAYAAVNLISVSGSLASGTASQWFVF